MFKKAPLQTGYQDEVGGNTEMGIAGRRTQSKGLQKEMGKNG